MDRKLYVAGRREKEKKMKWGRDYDSGMQREIQ